MHNVQNVPKKCLSFMKYPLAVFAGYGLVTAYMLHLTVSAASAPEQLVVVTPISVEWDDATTIPDPVQTVETYDLPPIELAAANVESEPVVEEETALVVTDSIDCASVLSSVGATHFCYTYMGWQNITSTNSSQYEFRKEHYPEWHSVWGNPDAFNSMGFAVVDGRYVVATTHVSDGGLFEVGDKFTAVLDNGITIPCIVGDIKSASDPNWTPYGHKHSDGLSLLEFIVDRATWYDTGHANPGTDGCMPEWNSPIVTLIKE